MHMPGSTDVPWIKMFGVNGLVWRIGGSCAEMIGAIKAEASCARLSKIFTAPRSEIAK